MNNALSLARLLTGAWAALLPNLLEAQLRPYEPITWSLFDRDHDTHLDVGLERYAGQRASLAGVSGSLWEFGSFEVAFRTGRVLISAGGTVVRIFDEEEVFAEPAGDAQPDPDGRRRDAGDYRISTTLRLTAAEQPFLGVLRFGTRLPTTDNRVGLERDQTDFFATLGARQDLGRIRATAEAGVGIHGTRDPGFEQSDVLIYSGGVQWLQGWFEPALLIMGHADGLPDRTKRGNEELAELRLRLQGGRTSWIALELVRGLMSFSPAWGVAVQVGTTR